jgi:MscS family membrane protein
VNSEIIEGWVQLLAGDQYGWILEMFLLVLAVLVAAKIANRVIDKLEAKAVNSHNLWDDALLEAARRPVVWLIWVVGLNFAATIASEQLDSGWTPFLVYVNKIAVVGLFAMFLVNFINLAEENLIKPEQETPPRDPMTIKAVAKLLRASVLVTAALIAMQLFGFSISGLLAFGGVGGLAIGFAAQDLLSNFFGGLMIYLDRPFNVGDWIRSPDQEIEGTVEDIGWRLTRIRTFDKRPLYVPNSVFASIALENPSRMTNRRIKETIGVRYDDVSQLPAILADVEAMLRSHEAIDTNQTLMVNFNEFGASSLDFFIYTFTKTTVWTEFHKIKQDVLLKVADIIAGHGAEIAFPTRTLHMATGGSD